MITAKARKKMKARVERGARLLDDKEPGWVDRFIEIGKNHGFDLSSPMNCVLGNVFRKAAKDARYGTGFEYAVNELGFCHPAENGFDSIYDPDDGGATLGEQWNALSDAWQEEILNRTDLKGQVEAIFEKEEPCRK